MKIKFRKEGQNWIVGYAGLNHLKPVIVPFDIIELSLSRYQLVKITKSDSEWEIYKKLDMFTTLNIKLYNKFNENKLREFLSEKILHS